MRKQPLGAGPYVKMVLCMVRDILLVLLIVALIIAIPGGVIAGLEYGTHFMDDLVSDSDVTKVITNPVFDVFVWGAAFDCFIIGLVGIGYGIAKCIGKTCETCCCFPVDSHATTYYTYDNYSYHSVIPAWWWWYVFLSPPRTVDPCCCCCCLDCCCDCCRACDCGRCDCDCGNCDCGNCDCGNCDCGSCDCGNSKDCGDAGAILIVILIVIVIIIIMIGFVIGLVFLIILTARIIKNHMTVLQKQKDAQELEVIDLSEGLAKDDPSVIVLGDNFEPISPFSGQAAYVCPARTESDHLLAEPVMQGPSVPVVSAGEGPTAPAAPVYPAGPTAPAAPVYPAGEGPTAPAAPVYPAGEAPAVPVYPGAGGAVGYPPPPPQEY